MLIHLHSVTGQLNKYCQCYLFLIVQQNNKIEFPNTSGSLATNIILKSPKLHILCNKQTIEHSIHVLYELCMCIKSPPFHTQAQTHRNNNVRTHTHTHTVTYLSGLHSGMLSVGMTETDGQCVSVRWTQTDGTKQQSKTKKQIISS